MLLIFLLPMIYVFMCLVFSGFIVGFVRGFRIGRARRKEAAGSDGL